MHKGSIHNEDLGVSIVDKWHNTLNWAAIKKSGERCVIPTMDIPLLLRIIQTTNFFSSYVYKK